MRNQLLRCAALTLVLTPVAGIESSLADRAIVIGVNKYKNLGSKADLKGCVNDAKSIAKALRAQGFVVEELKDSQATKQGIVKALDKAKAQCQSTEKFVFYFAGHGARKQGVGPVLLPYDYSNTSFVGTDELYDAVRSVPAASRTVLLDSCFSGAFSRDVRDPTLRSRYFPVDSGGAGAPETASGGDSTEHLTTKKEVCYFTACRKIEQAYEQDQPAGTRGLFTRYLESVLTDRVPTWKSAEQAIVGSVAMVTKDEQHPTLSPEFKDLPFLGSAPAIGTHGTTDPVVKPKMRTVWDEYLISNPDPKFLKLRLDPDNTRIPIQQDGADETKGFHLVVEVGAEDGYLVLLDRDPSGAIWLLYPEVGRRNNLEMLHVSALQRMIRPEDNPETKQRRFYFPNKRGTERINAILFRSKERALALIEAFPESGKLETLASAQSREVRIGTAPASTTGKPYYTSDVIFETVEP